MNLVIIAFLADFSVPEKKITQFLHYISLHFGKGKHMDMFVHMWLPLVLVPMIIVSLTVMVIGKHHSH